MQNLQSHLIDCILQSWITIKAIEVFATKRIKTKALIAYFCCCCCCC